MDARTSAIHAGRAVDPTTGAVAPPICLSTTFQRGADGGYPGGFSYGREDNPNRRALETLMTALEGGARSFAFASGMAAAAAVFQSLRPGDHVVAPRDIYHGVRRLLNEVMTPWGLRVTYAPLHEPGAIEAAMTEATRLIWLETPSNPTLHITDIVRAADLAHQAGALCACDNTFASPALQRPIEHGADLVMHATTKWIAGHSDSAGGVIVCRNDDEFAQRLRSVQQLVGGVCAPFDAWLATRGAASLFARVDRSAESALAIARFLEAHPCVERALHPGLESHAGHALASRQMSGFGAMVAMLVRGGREEAMNVAARVRLFTRATSLGGVESLIEQRETIEGPDSPTPPNLLRLSIGQESAQDLMDDLDQALRASIAV